MDMDFNRIFAAFSAVASKQTLSEAAEKSDKPWTDMKGNKHPGTAVKGDKYTGKEAEKDSKKKEVDEGKKPDFLDVDKDGDKKEPMKKAIADKKSVKESSIAELIAKMDAIIESAEKVDEEEMEEGNEFSGELAKAKAAGKDDFEVDGKKYQVKESEKKETTWTDMKGKKHPATQVKGDKYTGKEAEKDDKSKKVDEAAEKKETTWTDMKGKKHPATQVKGDKYTGKEAEKEDKKKVDEARLAECGMMADMGGESDSGMSVNTSIDTRTGRKTVSISADGEKADELMQMLKLAGMKGMVGMGDVDGDGDHDIADHAQEMGAEVVSIPLAHAEGGYKGAEEVEEEYSNEPNPQTQGVETQLRQGTDMHKEKTMHKHSYRQGDNPMAMREAKELAMLEAEIMEELEAIKVKKPTSKYANTFKKPTVVKKVR